jgi:hypothetical protein
MSARALAEEERGGFNKNDFDDKRGARAFVQHTDAAFEQNSIAWLSRRPVSYA